MLVPSTKFYLFQLFIVLILSSFPEFQCLYLCMFYSLVGSLNKIPISIAGIIVFNVPLSISNLFSILFGNLSEPLNISFFLFLYGRGYLYLSNIHNAHYFQVSLLVYYLQEPRCLKPEAIIFIVITNEVLIHE